MAGITTHGVSSDVLPIIITTATNIIITIIITVKKKKQYLEANEVYQAYTICMLSQQQCPISLSSSFQSHYNVIFYPYRLIFRESFLLPSVLRKRFYIPRTHLNRVFNCFCRVNDHEFAHSLTNKAILTCYRMNYVFFLFHSYMSTRSSVAVNRAFVNSPQ